MDVNLVESIYGKVKKKQIWKKNHVSGLFLESIFFLYKQNIQYRKLRRNILAFAILSLRKHWRVSPIYITRISPSYMMIYLVYRACVNHAVKFAQEKICCKFIFVQIEKRISILENKAVHRLICFNKTIIIHFIQSKRKSC